jgi:hypothetical protein
MAANIPMKVQIAFVEEVRALVSQDAGQKSSMQL